MLTDEQIMYEVAAGDVQRCSVLFDRYQVKIYNYFLRCTYDQFLSEDLTQQVFVKLIKYKSSFKNDASFKSWIYRIASNVKNDHYRKEKSFRNRNEVYSDKLEKEVNPMLKIEKTEQESQLHIALNRLSHDQREVIWMTRFEKMKYAEVAKILNCTESAVKVKVHRAIKKLKIEFLQLEKL